MKIRLIVPNGPNASHPVGRYGPRIADIAGGFTATQATGGWKDNDGQLIVEPVTVFDCSCPTGIGDDWRDIARDIAKDLSQTCVYLEIDGVVEYVTP